MSEEYSNGYARGYEAGQESMLKLAEQPAQQEPVAFLDWYDNAHWGNEDFKAGCWRAWDAALAQRTWVGLTEFDIDQIPYSCSHADSRLIAYAIEAKLKEKNT